MPRGSFRKGWNEAASNQRRITKVLMWAVAGNDDLMNALEDEASKLAAEKKYGALPWAEIIQLLLPILLKIIQEKLSNK